MPDYEKLGAFYLGRIHDMESGITDSAPMLYDTKDLTTHAVCVGMTGSGKTGLCLSLLEEAAIDGIPAIAIDPKGDLGNLMLTFPELKPGDFQPWIEESEAARNGMTVAQYAAHVAKMWRDGLAKWDQDPSRIQRLRSAVDLAIYTPGSSAGLPLTVLRSFAAPPQSVIDDSDAMRERVSSSASGLLALLGIDADPIRSREHILLSNVLDRAWREGRSLDIAGLIHAIQSPPFDKVGIMDLESFFPATDRNAMSMQLNNLLASPSFASWMEGEPLDIKRLLYTEEGKPRLSVISIAHLSEPERMFFVTILLTEMLAWTRCQSGTSSLRALLYMDEVFGYFPPTANPPSKTPMLTLLKQARAYGVGIVLATQNPVDLDYKGLSNTGTWFLGRLQTERDKARVLDGLEGASAETGAEFDRAKIEATLSAMGKRLFLMNNVHDDHPVVFRTRWALSYLRGPLTRTQIQELMADRKKTSAALAAHVAPGSRSLPPTRSAATPVNTSTVSPPAKRPVIPSEGNESFIPTRRSVTPGGRLVYRPALLGAVRLHFVRATYKVDNWLDYVMIRPIHDEDLDDVWESAELLDDGPPELEKSPESDIQFSPAPTPLTRKTSYRRWKKELADYLYREKTLTVWKCNDLKRYSEPGETAGDFRVRLRHHAKEKRDLEIEKLRKKFAAKLKTVEGQLRRAQERVDREEDQYRQSKLQTAVSFGTSILGALFGRKLASRTNVGRAGTAMRSAGRTMGQRGDIDRAKANAESYDEKLQELEAVFNDRDGEVGRFDSRRRNGIRRT